MITRIELTNFMSHAHTVIEPAAGLTVLVGPNNVGKSAVVAALQILCHNENSTYVLRHGAKQCSVKVETDDGHSIEWRRKNSPSYVIDGQTFDRLKGSGLPDELHQALRLPTVDAGNDADFDVHFGTQKEPIFLLGSSASNAAKFFASSSDAIRLVAIQKLHKERLAEAQREKGRLEAESKQLHSELELLEPVVDLDRCLEIVEQSFEDLTRRSSQIQEAEVCQASLQAKAVQFAQYDGEVQSLSRLKSPPQLIATEPLEQLIESLIAAAQKHEQAQAQSVALTGLGAPPSLSDVASVAGLIDGLSFAAERVVRGSAEVLALSELAIPPELHNVEVMASVSHNLAALEREQAIASDNCTVLQTIAAPPEFMHEAPLVALEAAMSAAAASVAHWHESLAAIAGAVQPPIAADLNELLRCIEQIDETAMRASACQEDSLKADAALAACASELRAAATGRTCSICGSPFDPDRVVARAAAGMKGHENG